MLLSSWKYFATPPLLLSSSSTKLTSSALRLLAQGIARGLGIDFWLLLPQNQSLEIEDEEVDCLVGFACDAAIALLQFFQLSEPVLA